MKFIFSSALIGYFLTAFIVLFPSSAESAAGSFIVMADQYPGATAGQKIQAALTALAGAASANPIGGVTGGVVDARNLSGNQVIDVPITLGVPSQWSVTLLLGAGTYQVKQMITVMMGSSIIGFPSGMSSGASNTPTTTLIAAPGANLWAVVRMGDGNPSSGIYSVLQDVTVDGGYSTGGMMASPNAGAVVVESSPRVDINRVTVQHSAGQGMIIRSPNAATNYSCCSKISKLMALNNQYSGLYIYGTSDTFIMQSEFENNLANGLELNTSPAVRVTNSDFGGNKQMGLYAYATDVSMNSVKSGQLIIDGNQFGNNGWHDLAIDGSNGTTYASIGNIINANAFIGSCCRASAAAYDAIHIRDSRANSITGNMINTWDKNGNVLYSGIHVFVTTQTDAPSLINGNVIDGPHAQGGAISATPANMVTGNLNLLQ